MCSEADGEVFPIPTYPSSPIVKCASAKVAFPLPFNGPFNICTLPWALFEKASVLWNTIADFL